MKPTLHSMIRRMGIAAFTLICVTGLFARGDLPTNRSRGRESALTLAQLDPLPRARLRAKSAPTAQPSSRTAGLRLAAVGGYRTRLWSQNPMPERGSPPVLVELWPGGAPEESGQIGPERTRLSPKLDRSQVEVTEQTTLITDVTKPTLTIFRPATALDTGTAIVICPGGGYWDLYWQLEGEEVAAWLNANGVTGIILKYRVPRRPDEPRGEPARRPLQDAQRAVSLVRSRASEWSLRPERIGIVGFSAGGHLALATATAFERRSYKPRDEIDQVSCRPDFAIAVYSGYLKAKDADELAPGWQIPTKTAPVFLAHGGEDPISPPEHSVLMYLALRRAGVPAELHVYGGATHDFGVRPSDQPCSTWTDACLRWLRHSGFLGNSKRR